MGYWCVVPAPVVYSNKIGDAELRLYIVISGNLNSFGYCDLSNEKLAKKLNTNERQVTRLVASLVKSGFVNMVLNRRKHRRQIYLNIQPDVLMETPPESYSPAQKKFADAFPDREIDCDIPDFIDIDLLIEEIKNSRFLTEAKNMSLKSCLDKYLAIISKRYANIKRYQPNFKEREYSKEEMNALFQSIDEIEI